MKGAPTWAAMVWFVLFAKPEMTVMMVIEIGCVCPGQRRAKAKTTISIGPCRG